MVYGRGSVAVVLCAVLACSAAAGTRTVNVNGTDEGRAFEGIGAVSAGANSRLLIDYPEPYRSDVLDFLFKPKFGAAFQHLKVEIGGGTNSTSGAEPSHAVVESEIADPVPRGYEFWLMAEARQRNPEILLDCLPWAFPYWLSDRFSQDSADYFTAFLKAARDDWGLELDWVAAAQNESGTDLGWVTNTVRPTMDAAGFEDVHIQSPDNSWAFWEVFDEFATHPDYDAVVEAVGYHYIDQKNEYPPADVIATGKPLWCSEDSVSGGAWTNGRQIVARMNRLYLGGKITKMEIWCPVDSCADGVNLGHVGAMQADTPWSGYYNVRPAIWGVAHYTQFTERGWVYIESGCGTLDGAGNYATLKDPATGDWSIIIYAEAEEDITFELSGGLSSETVGVWKSTEPNLFEQQGDIIPSGGVFAIHCDADSLYSLTTTTGQQKGVPAHTMPEAAEFPFPYSEDFEGYNVGVTPKYLSDMQGTFEVASCKGGRSGKCVEQLLPQVGYTWGWDWCNPPVPMTMVPSEPDWADYEASMDVYVEQGEVYVAARKGGTQKYCGYALVLEKDGAWRLCYDDVTNSNAVLARGLIGGFDGGSWHKLAVRCEENQIDGFVDERRVCSVVHGGRFSGQVCFGGSYDRNQFDNLQVAPAGPEESLWTVLDDTDASLTWSGYWGTWPQADYYGGSCKYTENVGCAVEFPFTGRVGRVIGLRRNDLGYIGVYVDGQLKASVDCYSSDTEYQAVLYETDVLESGPHLIRAEVTGEQNPASSGFEIVLDAFAYTDSIGGWCPDLRENLALSAAASASSEWSVDYVAEKVNDGDPNSRWNSEGGDVEGSWVALDFGDEVTFGQVKLAQYDDRIQGYEIEYYDGSQWADACVGGVLGAQPVMVSFPAVTGTGVRLLVTDATTVPSIWEFEVYATVGDFDGDNVVGLGDVAAVLAQWLREGCGAVCECDRADLVHDGRVDLRDFSLIADWYAG